MSVGLQPDATDEQRDEGDCERTPHVLHEKGEPVGDALGRGRRDAGQHDRQQRRVTIRRDHAGTLAIRPPVAARSAQTTDAASQTKMNTTLANVAICSLPARGRARSLRLRQPSVTP